MAFLNSLNISGSALTASRLRMDVVSENIANATTTRTVEGGPYRRKMVVYEAKEDGDFRSLLAKNMAAASPENKGVKVAAIVEDQTPFNIVYDPENPDANKQGYVEMPNVDLVKETIDMMAVTRAYDANLTVLNAVKSMAAKALEIGR
ncbi:MAG: flagellar basal body rod protein FlgC [Clostridia bacterium]|jgi:flagellar basal-body rod protein FlgC|nr:flagellar basal body rod protein FlgC [Clostridia bacterium]MDD4571263.1 flagellar basal body rod protein FlgC [Clostridia bacterium]